VSPEAVETGAVKPFSDAMRASVVGPATRGLLGALLFLLSTRTADYFAWTIATPLTAATLGANYWASTVLAILASRERYWANGRISISVAFVFSPLMTAATFLHLGEFHFDAGGVAVFITWFWVLAYGFYPIQLTVQMVQQLRLPGGDPPRTDPLPLWVKTVLGAHALVFIPLGVLTFVAPGVGGPLWPWEIGAPLALRALSAWVLAFGVGALHAILENDFDRVKVALWGYPVLGALQLIALVRFGEVLQTNEAGWWFYLAFLASAFVLGAYGYVMARRLRSRRAATA